MNQDFSTTKRINAMETYMLGKILPNLEQTLKTVAAVRNDWEFLEGRKREFSEKRDNLKTEINDLQGQSLKLARNGGDPAELSKQLHDRKVELIDVEGWLVEIDAKIAALRPERDEAEKGLDDALQAEIRPIAPKYRDERDGYLQAASEIDSSWFRAIQKVVRKIRNTDWPATWRPSQISFPLRGDPKRSNYKKMGMG
jgi:hypothetical protein